MNFGDIEAIKQIEKSNIDPRSALVQMAGDKVLRDYHGSLFTPLIVTLGAAGYALSVMASPPLAIAIALAGGWIMVDKVQRGERAFDDIENGRLEKYLNEAQRKVLAQLPPVEGLASQPALPAAVDVPAVPVGAIAAPPVSAQWTPQQWALWNRLMGECPDMRFVLMAKLVVVSGPQQCGKSSLASAIAYARSFLLGWDSTAVTPHVDGASIFHGRVIGSGRRFGEIQAFYENLVDNFSMGSDRQSLVIDELSQYTDEHQPLGQNLVRSAVTEADKHGINCILINHAKTLSGGFSGIKGFRELLDNSCVQLTRQYDETDWGEQVRSPQVTVSRPGKAEITLTVPDWFWLPILQQDYPMEAIAPVEAPTTSSQVASVAPPPHPQQQDEVPNPFQLTPEMLERLYQNSPDTQSERGNDELTVDPAILSELDKALRALVIFAHKKGDWVTASDIRSGVRIYRNTQITAEDIRDDFRSLAANGIGVVDGEGESLKYRF